MNREPCARLTRFMMPKVSVRSCGHQEQNDAELQPVQNLLDKQQAVSGSLSVAHEIGRLDLSS